MKYAVIFGIILVFVIFVLVGICIFKHIKKKNTVNIDENIGMGRITAIGAKNDYTITIVSKKGTVYTFNVTDGALNSYKNSNNTVIDFNI